MAAEAQISAKHIELNEKRKLEETRKGRNILCMLVWRGREVYGQEQKWIEKKIEAQAWE